MPLKKIQTFNQSFGTVSIKCIKSNSSSIIKRNSSHKCRKYFSLFFKLWEHKHWKVIYEGIRIPDWLINLYQTSYANDIVDGRCTLCDLLNLKTSVELKMPSMHRTTEMASFSSSTSPETISYSLSSITPSQSSSRAQGFDCNFRNNTVAIPKILWKMTKNDTLKSYTASPSLPSLLEKIFKAYESLHNDIVISIIIYCRNTMFIINFTILNSQHWCFTVIFAKYFSFTKVIFKYRW